jgi:hypothetical protein
VTARDVSNGKSHRQNRQAKSQRHTQEADADIRESRGQHPATTAAQDEPKRTDEFRRKFFIGESPSFFDLWWRETFYREIDLSARIIWQIIWRVGRTGST